MAAKRKTRHYYSTYDLASTVSFGMQVSVNDSDHGRVVRIFVCLPENGTATGSQRERSSNGGQRRDKSAHISATKVSFSTNFYHSGQCWIAITAV